jgi:hypothetical protein
MCITAFTTLHISNTMLYVADNTLKRQLEGAIQCRKDGAMRTYVMITDGEIEVIPLDVDVRNFTYIIISGKRVDRSPSLMKNLHYYNVNGEETAVFMLSRKDLEAF